MSVETLFLVGVGDVWALPAGELRAGMTIRWNYDVRSRVVSVRRNDRVVDVVEEYGDGTRYARQWRCDRLIACLVPAAGVPNPLQFHE